MARFLILAVAICVSLSRADIRVVGIEEGANVGRVEGLSVTGVKFGGSDAAKALETAGDVKASFVGKNANVKSIVGGVFVGVDLSGDKPKPKIENKIEIETERESEFKVGDATYKGRKFVVIADGERAGEGTGEIFVTVEGSCESIDLGAGRIEVRGDAGRVKTGSGDVHVEGATGKVTTGSGDVEVDGYVGETVSTGSGDVHVEDRVDGDASSMSGDVIVYNKKQCEALRKRLAWKECHATYHRTFDDSPASSAGLE